MIKMSWQDEIKKDFPFDFDGEMKTIYDALRELAGRYQIAPNEPLMKEISNSLEELQYWYDSVKEKLQ